MNKTTVGKAFIWKLLERFSVAGMTFIIQIVLARLLLPSDFGAIAILLVFVQISNVFVQNGFNTALVQAKEVDDDDYSSVLWLNLMVAGVLYLLWFFLAPSISLFYANPDLVPTLRVLAIMIFPGAVNSVQIAHLSRELNFRAMFVTNFIAVLLSGAIGIGLAMVGVGVWALVFQQLSNVVLVTVVMIFVVKWRPRFVIRWHRLRALFRFGSKLLASSLLDTLYNNVYNVVVGKLYDAKTLGYYSKAAQFPTIIVDTLNGAISSVLLPVMSKVQDHLQAVKSMMRKSIVMSSYVIFPIMTGLALCAEPIIILLLTEKWQPAVPFLQILCFTYIFFPIHTSNLQAINAIGRSDIYLKLEVLKKIVGVVSILVTVPFGVMAMTWSKIAYGFISSLINAWPNKQLLQYSYLEQIKDILPNMIATAIMALFVYLCSLLPVGLAVRLIIQIVVGILSYLIISKVMKLEGYTSVIEGIRQRRAKANQ